MKPSPHIMPLAVQDYRTSRVRNRSITTSDPILRTLYLELLLALWERGGEIAADPESVADEVGLPADEIAPRLKILSQMGETGRGGIVIAKGKITNARVSEDLSEAARYRDQQSAKGLRSAAARRERGATAVEPELDHGSASVEPPTPTPDPSPTPSPSSVAVPSVPASRRGHQHEAKPRDLGAYMTALEDLWPEQPLAARLAVERSLFSVERELPELAEFRANLEAWLAAPDKLREHVWPTTPKRYLDSGAFKSPPPTKRSPRAKVSIDDLRRDVLNEVWKAKLTEDARAQLVERARAATTAAELGEIREEARRVDAA